MGNLTDAEWMKRIQFVKIEIFIPEENLAALQAALQRAGAGAFDRYDSCLSYAPVTGTWRPLENARPYRGTVGQIFQGEEVKVEVNCRIEAAADVLRAVREIHPCPAAD